jgi:sigma-B regulation protein RsbU (phosphoserine phosphatase)
VNVLIAEDEQTTRMRLQRNLEKMGYRPTAAENGAKAWELFQNGDFSLVLTDWMMPEMDGLELVRHIRGSEQEGYTYIIMLTAKSETSEIVEGMEAGADDFVTKPFDRNELRVRVGAGERIVKLERSLAEHNRRMKNDLDAAAKVQQSLLPTSDPDTSHIPFAWEYIPCDELAGDFLNCFPLDETHIAAFVVDVSGHGVASSLLSVTVGRVMTPHVSSSSLLVQKRDDSDAIRIVPPAEVAYELNQRFPMEEQNDLYFTLAYGILDTETLEFRYVLAGHVPLIHVPHDGAPQRLDADGLAIGFFEDMEFDEYTVQLRPGDRLYIYSDGVPEAMDEGLNEFGERQMLEIMELGKSQSLDDSVSLLLQAVERWCAKNGPKDDVSILGVEIPAGP